MEKEKEIVLKAEEEALSALEKANNAEELTSWKNTYLSKKSPLAQLMNLMRQVLADEKAAFGKLVNDTRGKVEAAFQEKMQKAQQKALEEKLNAEKIDITLPGRNHQSGYINPYWKIVDEMSDIFASMGFDIVEGRDVETDHFNFELLNVPKDHPARDMQDTFYISDTLLLRTQTSAAQAHTMLENEEKKPIKMICPGKCYRRDDDDATHSHEFGQIEGLVIDKGISMADLKGTLELFVKKMFGEKREIRLRSPSSRLPNLQSKLTFLVQSVAERAALFCKNTGWIEILGAGEVHPHVLEMCGYDPKVYSGFAFGVGIERIAMLRYGIDDIRRIYTNDVRFLKDFSEK